jgi:RNA polymerase sigma-70 factor (ECF subfamily)
LNEADLIARLLDGDGPAQEEFYRLYQRRLYATACHFLGHNDPDAEDLVQETFLAGLKGLAQFQGRSSLYWWLNHICVNLCYARLRRREKTVQTLEEDLEARMTPAALDQHQALEDGEHQQLRLGRVGLWLEKLGERCRELMHLRFFEGLSILELKERLKVPQGTVASRLARCQAALKQIAEKDPTE